MKRPFQICFCEFFGCRPEEYTALAFRHCLYTHARPLAPALARLMPSFFAEDFAFLRELGAVTSRSEAITELNRFFGRNVRDKNWLRRSFAIRISGKRVLRLYRTISRAQG